MAISQVTVDLDRAIFNDAFFPYLSSMARTQIFYGGSASGKSVFLAQRCIYDMLCGGRNYLICREVGRTIRGSVFTEVCKIIFGWGVGKLFTINKTDMLITCSNGYQIIFAGLDDAEKLKSLTPTKGAITDVWLEEATETSRNTVKLLYKRQRGGSEQVPKRFMMSFNPIYQTHWIYEEFFGGLNLADKQSEYKSDRLTILKTNYKNNRFLTSNDVEDLENETDKYYFEVYTLGNWGVLGNVIFTNWRVEDLSNMRDQFTNRRNGLDFGFANDPAALSVSHYDVKRKIIYIYDELYEIGLTNPELAGLILPICGRDIVVCDSAEPKSIKELRDNKVNAVGARKGKDSVNFGIQWLQQQEIVIDTRCINSRNEFMIFKWKENKNGVAIPIPVDHNNDIIDATRYAYENDSYSGRTVVSTKARISNYLTDPVSKEASIPW